MATRQFDPASSIYQVRITLEGVEPPIWRRIEIQDCSLEVLHEVIQTAMGWENFHLYEFRVDDDVYTNPIAADEGKRSAAEVTLGQLSGRNVTVVEYMYDFSDNWTHRVEIEALQSPEQGVHYPRCVDGARACPPEDCGGADRYATILAVLKDPDHVEYDDVYDLIDENFDSEAFDADGVNRMWASWDFSDPDSGPTYDEQDNEPEPEVDDRRAKAKPKVELTPGSHSHVARNDPCPCGSGKKYKKCCLKRGKDDEYDD